MNKNQSPYNILPDRCILTLKMVNIQEKWYPLLPSYKKCKTCDIDESKIKLMKCAKCQCNHIFYCSKKCQKVDWKNHCNECKCLDR
jgi:hypothetical protein